jgi:hypothetical protein
MKSTQKANKVLHRTLVPRAGELSRYVLKTTKFAI